MGDAPIADLLGPLLARASAVPPTPVSSHTTPAADAASPLAAPWQWFGTAEVPGGGAVGEVRLCLAALLCEGSG